MIFFLFFSRIICILQKYICVYVIIPCRLNVALCYDDIFEAVFQNGALRRAKVVMAIVAALYSEKTMSVKIDINMLAYKHCSGHSWNNVDYGVHL